MAGKSPGGLTEVKKPSMISSEVLEINGLAETRPVTQDFKHSSSPPDTTTSGAGIEGKTKLWPSSQISHLSLTANPRSMIIESTDDERRLLPGNYMNDPDAVLIGRPKAKGAPFQMAGGVISGGPRPTNTLASKPFEFSNRVGALTNGIKRRVGAAGALFTKAAYGDNVKRPDGREALADLTTERDAKRPKLGSSSRSQDSVEIFDGDDNVDMLSMEEAHFKRERSPRRKSRTPSSLSQYSNRNLTSHPRHNRYVNEYRVVESTMDSKPGGRRGAHRQLADQSSTSTMSANNGSASIIDLSTDDALLKATPRYRGTARPEASRATASTVSRHSGPARQTGHTSDHFQKPSSSGKAFDLTGKVYIPTVRGTRNGNNREPNLRESFVQSDGRRRSSNISLSSDELQNEPYDIVTRVSPQQRTVDEELQRRNVDDVATADNRPTGLPQSNIPSTNFSTSGRNFAPQKPLASRAQETNREKFLGVHLVSFSYGSLTFEEANGQSSGLVGNKSDGCLDVYVDGRNITARSSGGRIQPEKLQKIIWGDSSRKMRLEFSKCGTEDGKGDLELGSEKDVAELVRYLQTSSPTCKVISKSSETLDKMFTTRSSAQKAHRRLGDRGLEHAAGDVGLIEARKQRRDGTSQALEQTEYRRSNRRRTDSRLIDQITKQSLLTRRSGNLSDDHSHESSMDAAESGVAQLLKKEKLSEISPINPLTTRSTVRRRKLSPSPFEGLAPELRYSKVQGLGPRWSKPLIYPKAGKKKTTVEYVDLERLDEGEFLNDNLIGFYLRFLEHKLEQRDADLAKRVYFFNTYFFASLTNTPRGKRGINYEAVQKWTRSVDLFQYDYVVVPINESAHWYVAIICNLPFINRFGVATNDDAPESPTIAQITDLVVSDERSASPLQQLSPKAAKEDVFTSLEIELEKPDEQDTRDSFAEMNLDDGMERPPHGLENTNAVRHANGPVDNDEAGQSVVPQAHANMDTGEPATDADETIVTVRADQILEQDTEVQRLPLKAPVSIRRGKRRSVPQRVYQPDQPTIITFDSLGLGHAPTVRNLKDYLHEEGKTKRDGMEWEDTQIKGMTAKDIPLQDNFCDCGLFLLGYVEKFLEDPNDFISRTLRKEIDKEKDWPRMAPTQLRSRVRELVMGLHDEQMDEKRENAIKAGKYRGNRQQVPTLLATDTAEPRGQAADVGDTVLPTALGNRVKPGPSAEPTNSDTLEDAVMVGGCNHSADSGWLPSKPAAAEEAQDHSENTHEVRVTKLSSNDSTPIVLDSQSQRQPTHERVQSEPFENGDITTTVFESQSEIPMTRPRTHVRDSISQGTTTNDNPVPRPELAEKNARRGQKNSTVVLCE